MTTDIPALTADIRIELTLLKLDLERAAGQIAEAVDGVNQARAHHEKIMATLEAVRVKQETP